MRASLAFRTYMLTKWRYFGSFWKRAKISIGLVTNLLDGEKQLDLLRENSLLYRDTHYYDLLTIWWSR